MPSQNKDIAEQATNSSSSTSKQIDRKEATIICHICSSAKNLSKYKRHLMTHDENNEISQDGIKTILFQFRTTRNDTKVGNITSRAGYRCYFSSTG